MASAESHHAVVSAYGATLVHLALDAIDHGLVYRRPLEVDLATLPEPFSRPCASVVSLRCAEEARGRAGAPNAIRSLGEDVALNAYAAAFSGESAAPLHALERALLTLTVTVLSPTEPLGARSESELLRALRPGRDGLLISDGRCRGVSLPEAWVAYPQPRDFLLALKRKAGMASDHWSRSFSAWRFTAASVTLSPDGAVAPC